jgi:hypothetical protein
MAVSRETKMDISMIVFIGVGATIAIGALSLNGSIKLPTAPTLTSIAVATGLTTPDKLGWMDDVEFTEADRQRVAQIGGRGFADNLGVIRNMQSLGRSTVTRRDYELMRQDRRRAQAAYPDVPSDNLTYGSWIQVDMPAHVPAAWGGGNSNSTREGDAWYLDGGDYQSFVKPEYTKRADAATTKRVLAELKDGARQKAIKHVAKWGYHTWWSGTGGSGLVNCYPDPLPSDQDADETHIPGMCVVVLGDTQYVFPFVPAEWASPPWEDDIKKLASFQQATATPYVRVEKPWVLKDGLLIKGEKCPEGRLCWSMWNGDGYDNKDIGPSNPAAWVLDLPFGLFYKPAPDNGEQRSDPSKPWFLVISYYGSAPQVSGGWTEAEAKAMLPKFQTGFSFGMQGQDRAELNRGNLREARATQTPPLNGALVLGDRVLPIAPGKQPEADACVQGGTLMPGQSCTLR